MNDEDHPVTAAPEAHSGATGVEPPAPTAPIRGTLDRQKILVAAVELIDSEGLRAFTMRSLGARLGVEAMALYRYVYGREALLDSIVEFVIDDLFDDPEVFLVVPNWQDYLARLAHGVRRIARIHPQVFPLIATRPPAAPWVQPPLRSLRWMESFLAALQDCGFDDRSSVAAYRAFSSFLLGHLLLEVSARGADTAPIDQPDPTPPNPADLEGFPILQRLEPELSQDRSTEEFEQSLESLLDRLDSHR